MWTNLAVGIFNVPTLNNAGASIDDRINSLKAGIQRLVSYRDQMKVSAPSPRWRSDSHTPSMIFVAPEYMFVPPGFQLNSLGDLKRNRFLSRDDRDMIVAELQKISMQYGRDLVFVPGTIAYREELPVRPVDRLEMVSIAQRHIRTSARAIENRFKAPGQSYLDTTVAGQLAGHAAETPNRKLKTLDAFKKINIASVTYYTATNIAYMFNNGRIIGSYAKRSDFHERLPKAHVNTIFVPGIKPGRATVGGINFGVEICLDHGIGVLKNTPSITGDLPRIHLVCSATVGNDVNSVMVREGGYLIHASSDTSNAGIYRRLGGYTNADNLFYDTVSGSELRMAVIELDI